MERLRGLLKNNPTLAAAFGSVARRWASLELATAWARWRDFREEMGHENAGMRVAAKFFYSGSIRWGFSCWVEAVVEARKAKRAMRWCVPACSRPRARRLCQNSRAGGGSICD